MARKHTPRRARRAQSETQEPDCKPTSAQKFKDEVNELFGAAVSVIIVRAREGYRALRLLHEISAAMYPDSQFRHWDSFNNWMFKDARGAVAKNAAGVDIPALKVADATEALARIDDLANNGADRWGKGVFVMSDLHKVFTEMHTPSVRVLLEYSESFSATKQRLALLMPDTFIVPPALEGIIPVVDLDYPTKQELRDELENAINDASTAEAERAFPFNENDTEMILDSAAGLTVQEALSGFAIAIQRHREEFDNGTMTAEQMNMVVLDAKTKALKGSACLERMEPVPVEEVGGLELLKDFLHRLVRRLEPAARRKGVDVPKGFALIGPPGTGKSLCAKAVAAFLRLPLIKFDISALFGGVIGETEGKTRAALSKLKAMAPCVVLWDEADKAMPDPRGYQGDTGVSKRMFGSILTFMQESKETLVHVMTANWSQHFDPALLRKGRMDEIFGVALPNPTERLEVLRIHLNKRGYDPDSIPGLKKFAEDDCYGLIGSELESLVVDSVTDAYVDGERDLTLEDFEKARDMLVPQSVSQKEDFEKMAGWIRMNARPTSRPDPKEEAKLALQGGIKPKGPTLKAETKFTVVNEDDNTPNFNHKPRRRRRH
jgi:ATP-dependent 26S proteasome regulatory subunit